MSGMSTIVLQAAPKLATAPRPDLTAIAPAMPPDFYGTVAFEYLGGKLTMVEVKERIKP